jgi:hypothetical protein
MRAIKRTFAVLGAVAALLLIINVGITRCRFSDTPPPDPSRIGAKRACIDMVRDRLRAPATAVFTETAVSHWNGKYKVVGKVESQDAYGALLRTRWRCITRWTGDRYAGDVSLRQPIARAVRRALGR